MSNLHSTVNSIDGATAGAIEPGAKVLVTGGTGFLGTYIIGELVRSGYAVRAIHRQGAIPFSLPTRPSNRDVCRFQLTLPKQ